jgi:hypothetical protein
MQRACSDLRHGVNCTLLWTDSALYQQTFWVWTYALPVLYSLLVVSFVKIAWAQRSSRKSAKSGQLTRGILSAARGTARIFPSSLKGPVLSVSRIQRSGRLAGGAGTPVSAKTTPLTSTQPKARVTNPEIARKWQLVRDAAGTLSNNRNIKVNAALQNEQIQWCQFIIVCQAVCATVALTVCNVLGNGVVYTIASVPGIVVCASQTIYFLVSNGISIVQGAPEWTNSRAALKGRLRRKRPCARQVLVWLRKQRRDVVCQLIAVCLLYATAIAVSAALGYTQRTSSYMQVMLVTEFPVRVALLVAEMTEVVAMVRLASKLPKQKLSPEATMHVRR